MGRFDFDDYITDELSEDIVQEMQRLSHVTEQYVGWQLNEAGRGPGEAAAAIAPGKVSPEATSARAAAERRKIAAQTAAKNRTMKITGSPDGSTPLQVSSRDQNRSDVMQEMRRLVGLQGEACGPYHDIDDKDKSKLGKQKKAVDNYKDVKHPANGPNLLTSSFRSTMEDMRRFAGVTEDKDWDLEIQNALNTKK
jgi:hypothetical protein